MAAMPLKIIWALLDVMTIVVIGSGLYLWIVKRRSTAATRSRGSHCCSRPNDRCTQIAIRWQLVDRMAARSCSVRRSVAGLLTALLSEGAGRYFSWLALGAPVAVTAWLFARRKCD